HAHCLPSPPRRSSDLGAAGAGRASLAAFGPQDAVAAVAAAAAAAEDEDAVGIVAGGRDRDRRVECDLTAVTAVAAVVRPDVAVRDRKSTRLNSSHAKI